MAKTSIPRCDRVPLRLALPLIAMFSIALWALVIVVVWGGWAITSGYMGGVNLALPIAVDIAQLH